jgi:hypothetical protein
MTTPKIVVGTLAVVVLAGIGVEGLKGHSAHHSPVKVQTRALTPAAATVTTPAYAPIDVVPAWVETERWTAKPSVRLGSGRRHKAKARHRAPRHAKRHAKRPAATVHHAVPVATPPTAHVTPPVSRTVTSSSGPSESYVGPTSSSRSATSTHSTTSDNGTTTTRTITTHVTTINGRSTQSTQTHVTVTPPPGG